jgi:RNA-binding protein
MSKLELSSAERSALRARAHALNPVVLIGDNGLTDAVLAEVERALKAHELIKIRAAGEEREARDAILARICDELSAAPVHHLGKVLIVYRPLPPGEAAKRAPRKPKVPRPLKRDFQNL